MADMNIDWGLLGQPNELSQFYKGQDDAQQNDLLQWKTAREKTLAGRDDLDYATKEAAQTALTAAKAKAAPKLAAKDYRGAAADMVGSDPATAKSYLDIQGSLSEQDQKISTASDAIIASEFPDIAKMPTGTRKAYWDANVAPRLKQVGSPAQVVDATDPDTPQGMQALQARYNHALGPKGVQEQGNSDRDYQEKMSAPVIIEGVAYDRKTMKPVAAPSQVKEVGGDSYIRPGFGPGVTPEATPGGDPAGAPPTPGPGQSLTVPGPVGDQISQAATAAGATPDEQAYLHRTAQIESGGNPAAQNGKSTGLFQFHPDTFASVGGKNINDVGDQTTAALTLARQDKAALTQALGREPTAAELYIAHQQGAPGAAAILSADPNASAVSVLMPIYRNPAVATQAIVRNGGKPDMTAGQFADMWRSKYGAAPAGGPAAPTAPPAADPTAWKAQPHDDSGDLTPDAVEYLAQQYVRTGQMTQIGYGKQATMNRDKVINKAQQIEAETGMTGADAVERHVQVKADSASLTKITGLRSQIEASEKTVQRNADYMLSLAPKGGGPTGSPALNTPIQYVRKQLAGSPDVAKFDQAIGTVADEYAKVMTSNTGSGGVSSDSARAEAYARLSKAATFGQLQQTIAAMNVEMANRVGSYREQETALRASIKGGSSKDAGPAAAPSKVIRYNAQGQRVQ